MRPKMSIRRGDEVVVIAGKDRGKRGEVTRVLPEANRVVVDGVNIVKRHLRRQPGSLQAGIIDMPAPLDRSNVMLRLPQLPPAHARGAHETRRRQPRASVQALRRRSSDKARK